MNKRTHPAWYAGAIGAVALALAASSGQLFTVGLPTTFHRAHTGSGSQFVHLEQTVMMERTPNDIEVEVAVSSVAPVQQRFVPELESGVEADLWAIDLTFRADPNIPLRNCEVAAFSGDDEYATLDDYLSSSLDYEWYFTGGCVPNDAPGPDFDGASILNVDLDSLGSGEEVEYTAEDYDGPQRPKEYTVTSYVLMPEGTAPTEVHVAWHRPHYIEITDLEVSDLPVTYNEPPPNWDSAF